MRFSNKKVRMKYDMMASYWNNFLYNNDDDNMTEHLIFQA